MTEIAASSRTRSVPRPRRRARRCSQWPSAGYLGAAPRSRLSVPSRATGADTDERLSVVLNRSSILIRLSDVAWRTRRKATVRASAKQPSPTSPNGSTSTSAPRSRLSASRSSRRLRGTHAGRSQQQRPGHDRARGVARISSILNTELLWSRRAHRRCAARVPHDTRRRGYRP
jgi:hypothetical protein